MIKNFIEKSWLLVIASFVFGLLLAFTNAAWKDDIERKEREAFEKLAKVLITQDEKQEVPFEVIEEPFDIQKKSKVIKIYVQKASINDECAGWAFIASGSGFADKIKLVVVLDAAAEKIKGFGVLSSNETPGFGDKIKKDFFRPQFFDAPAEELSLSKIGDATLIDSEIIAISGATVSSDAVVTILNGYVTQIKEQLKERSLF